MSRDKYPLHVIVYTEPGVAGCEQVRKFLHARGIEFIERDILQDLTAVAELRKLTSGHLTVPVTQVGKDVIVGLDLQALEQHFGPEPLKAD